MNDCVELATVDDEAGPEPPLWACCDVVVPLAGEWLKTGEEPEEAEEWPLGGVRGARGFPEGKGRRGLEADESGEAAPGALPGTAGGS